MRLDKLEKSLKNSVYSLPPSQFIDTFVEQLPVTILMLLLLMTIIVKIIGILMF